MAINCCDAALVALLGLRRLVVAAVDFFLAWVPAPEALAALGFLDLLGALALDFPSAGAGAPAGAAAAAPVAGAGAGAPPPGAGATGAGAGAPAAPAGAGAGAGAGGGVLDMVFVKQKV